MRQPSQRPYHPDPEDELYNERFSVMSSTECTGLIPAAPVDEAEADSYQEIYDIPLSHEKPGEQLRQEKKIEKDERARPFE
ncbi:MAG: hypothetical protein HFG26_12265 [Provencibacterium sp.]|jgi:hypothetical protein|nr:hypothetical protein [Provencibacterium sp.]